MAIVFVESIDPHYGFVGRDAVLPLGGADFAPSPVASFHDERSKRFLVSTTSTEQLDRFKLGSA